MSTKEKGKRIPTFLKNNRRGLVILLLATAGAVACWYMARVVIGNPDKSLQNLAHHIHPQTAFTIGGFTISESVVNGWIATGLILLMAVIFRLFIVPRMKVIPGKMQFLAEKLIENFNRVSMDARCCAKKIGPVVFALSSFICVSTLLELVGRRPPLADINAALAVAGLAFILLQYYTFKEKGLKRLRHDLNPVNLIVDLAVPFSMTFHLYGGILGGTLLMTALNILIAPVVPAVLAIFLVVIHAVLQAYIFAMLTATFLGEAVEHEEHTKKRIKS